MQNAYYPMQIQSFKIINQFEVLLQGSWISISDFYYAEIQLITISFQQSEKFRCGQRVASTRLSHPGRVKHKCSLQILHMEWKKKKAHHYFHSMFLRILMMQKRISLPRKLICQVNGESLIFYRLTRGFYPTGPFLASDQQVTAHEFWWELL